MNAESHLRAVGVLTLLLAGLHGLFPGWFSWRSELGRLSLLNRQMFLVHAAFIVLVLVLTGLLSLFMAPALVREPLGTAVCGGLAAFWGARLATQFCVYDSRLWRGSRARTALHACAAVSWTYFTGVYARCAIA